MFRGLAKIRLRSRVAANFAVAGTIAVVVVGGSWWTVREALDAHRRFDELGRRARFDLTVVQAVSELQRHAQMYTALGHESAADGVRRHYERLRRALAERRTMPTAGGEDELARIGVHLSAYYSTFETLRAQRARRTELAQTLEEAAARAESAMLELGPSSKTKAYAAVHDLLRAERSAQRYFEGLDSRDVQAAKRSLHRVETALDGEPAVPEVVEAQAALQAYEASFLEAVQRTRGYLFLVNVVMAAEAWEVIHAAKRIEAIHAERMSSEAAAVVAALERSSRLVAVLAVCGLLLLAGMSVGLYRSVTAPIQRLTETFRELAKGRRDLIVPDYPVQDEIGELTAAASVFRDRNIETERLLTQSRRLTEDLEEKQRALTRSNEELEQFVYTVSHDLKSPLVTSSGFIAIAQRLAARGDFDEAAQKLERVVKANERMSALIDDLLDLSRVGRIDVDVERVALGEVLEELENALEPRLRTAGLELSVSPGLPDVWANQSRVLQVFENLLGNAVKYAAAPAGSRVEIGAREGDEAVHVYVRDDGPGIAPPFHDKVFGLFQRLDTDAEGTGIGLAVVRKVMRFHGGDAWVESEAGQGATFWLRFPRPPVKGGDR